VKGTLSARLIVWVGVPATLLFAVVITLASVRSSRRLAEEAKARAQTVARQHAAELEGVLRQAEKIPEMVALNMEQGALDTPEKVETFLRLTVEKNPEIYGSAIAFKPFGFKADVRDYGPYWYRSPQGLQFVPLGTGGDYNYPQWDWYRRPRDLGEAIWTEPYFDEGGGNVVMITRSVPFRRQDQFWGIATIDLPVTKLAEIVRKVSMSGSGYAVLLSKEGRFVTHPDETQVLHAHIGDANPDLGARIAKGEDGWMLTRDPLHAREAWVAYAPILDGSLSLAVIFPHEVVLADARKLLVELLALGAVGLAVLFSALVVVARSISKPIRQLSAAAKQIAAGDLETHLEHNDRTEEVASLTIAFNKMIRDLRMQMQELRYTTTVRERLEGELSAARSIQMSLLPKVFPAFPDRREFDVHAIVRPAREVGGDFYDFFLIDEHRLCVLISDVSGKGVPAALFMAVSKALLKATALSGLPLTQVMHKVNDELCEEADGGMFVTLLVAILDTATGEIEYSNAGHTSPFLLTSDGVVSPLDGGHAPALALATGLDFPVAKHRLGVADALFFFTDGVTEAQSKSREFYSPRRLQIVLRDVFALPVQRITRSVVQDVRAFAADQEQTDDISVLALRWLGAPEQHSADTATVPAKEPLTRSLAANLTPPHGR
jgi:phosphoserine phosphatase RsbU/P